MALTRISFTYNWIYEGKINTIGSPYKCQQFKSSNRRWLFENISLFEILWIDINMVGSQVKIGGRDGSHAPIAVRSKNFLFIRIGSVSNILFAQFIDCFCDHRLLLGNFFGLLFNFLNIGFLQGRWLNIHTKDNISNFALSQRSNIDVIFFGEVA